MTCLFQGLSNNCLAHHKACINFTPFSFHCYKIRFNITLIYALVAQVVSFLEFICIFIVFIYFLLKVLPFETLNARQLYSVFSSYLTVNSSC
jgi:hypothetical protein